MMRPETPEADYVDQHRKVDEREDFAADRTVGEEADAPAEARPARAAQSWSVTDVADNDAAAELETGDFTELTAAADPADVADQQREAPSDDEER